MILILSDTESIKSASHPLHSKTLHVVSKALTCSDIVLCSIYTLMGGNHRNNKLQVLQCLHLLVSPQEQILQEGELEMHGREKKNTKHFSGYRQQKNN